VQATLTRHEELDDRQPQVRRRRAEWALFEESSHMPHVDEQEAFLGRVENFPRTID